MASEKSAKAKHRKVNTGIVHIYAGFNNVIVTVTDMFGDTIASSSSGQCGFKGAKKSTPFAAQVVAESVAKKVQDLFGLKTVSIMIKGPGGGRESAIRALAGSGLIVVLIKDITPIPHNGCRSRKKRMV